MDRKKIAKRPSLCNCINLRRASRAITEFYDAELEPCGLKVTQYSLLRNLIQSGPLNMSELAFAMRIDRTTLARNLKALETRNLLVITTGTDSRTRQLGISENGRAAVEDANQYWEDAQRQLKEYLGEADLETLTGLLIKVEEIAPRSDNF